MKLLPITLELVGIAAIGTGIGVELITRAPLYLIVVTGGSCLIAIGSVIWAKFLRRGESR